MYITLKTEPKTDEKPNELIKALIETNLIKENILFNLFLLIVIEHNILHLRTPIIEMYFGKFKYLSNPKQTTNL